jgi:hypothetical protein
MTPAQFINDMRWKERKREINLEVISVCFPIFIYVSSLLILNFFIDHSLVKIIGAPEVKKIWSIPDGLFGSCIIFSLGIIRTLNMQESCAMYASQIFKKIQNLRMVSIFCLIASVLFAGFSVALQFQYSMIPGLFSLFIAFSIYKKIMFNKSYLELASGD